MSGGEYFFRDSEWAQVISFIMQTVKTTASPTDMADGKPACYKKDHAAEESGS